MIDDLDDGTTTALACPRCGAEHDWEFRAGHGGPDGDHAWAVCAAGHEISHPYVTVGLVRDMVAHALIDPDDDHMVVVPPVTTGSAPEKR